MARKKKDEVVETTEAPKAKTSTKGAKVISYRQGLMTLSTGTKVEYKKPLELTAAEMKEFTSLVDAEMYQEV